MPRKPWEPKPDTIMEDLVAVAAGKRRSTDPMPAYVYKRLRDGLGRWKKNRGRGPAEKRKAERAAKRAASFPRPRHRALMAMQPGEWYGASTIARASNCQVNIAWELRNVFVKEKGWAERVLNPKWDPTPINPWRIRAGEVREPQWLYRLTEAGIAERDRVIALVVDREFGTEIGGKAEQSGECSGREASVEADVVQSDKDIKDRR